MNFAAINLKKRAIAAADKNGLTGDDREVFIAIATHSGIGFNSLMRLFDVNALAVSMARLMESKLLFQQYSSSFYYTIAI